MSILLEDLAEETSAGNWRAADRLDAEARDLSDQRRAECALGELRQQAIESARQATEYVLARLPQAEGVWKGALATLRKNPAVEDAVRLLRSLLIVFESGQRLVRTPRALWNLAQEMETKPERLEELDQAEARFAELVQEAKRAIEFRQRERHPADPARLALGLQQAREGKTVNSEEARAWFKVM
jgi:hypothetical protein